MDKQVTTRYRPGQVSSAGSIEEISLPLPFSDALKHIESAFLGEGFELSQRLPVSTLIKNRIGVEVEPMEMLFLIHPVLAFEALVAGDDAAGLLPLVITLKASSNKNCTMAFRASISEIEDSDKPLAGFVAAQSRKVLSRAISRVAAAI